MPVGFLTPWRRLVFPPMGRETVGRHAGFTRQHPLFAHGRRVHIADGFRAILNPGCTRTAPPGRLPVGVGNVGEASGRNAVGFRPRPCGIPALPGRRLRRRVTHRPRLPHRGASRAGVLPFPPPGRRAYCPPPGPQGPPLPPPPGNDGAPRGSQRAPCTLCTVHARPPAPRTQCTRQPPAGPPVAPAAGPSGSSRLPVAGCR